MIQYSPSTRLYLLQLKEDYINGNICEDEFIEMLQEIRDIHEGTYDE